MLLKRLLAGVAAASLLHVAVATAAPTPPPGALPQIGSNSVLANASASTAVPSGVPIPNCNTINSALTYTLSGGAGAFGCNSLGGTGTVTTSGTPAAGELSLFTSATAISNGNISGDCTTTNTLTLTCTKLNGVSPGTFYSANAATPPSIGSTTPAAAAFTTLAASSTVSGSGFSTWLAGQLVSPPPIGSTTPNTGAFSTLSASGAVSGVGFTSFLSTQLASPPAIGGTTPGAGHFTTLSATGSITPSTTNGVVGTTLGDNANAGSEGEYISSSVLSGAAVSLVSGTPKTITSVALTAGDWECSGSIQIAAVGSTTLMAGGISPTTNTLPAGGANGAYSQFTLAFTGTSGFPTGTARDNTSSAATAFLVADATFTGGPDTAYGYISCVRQR